MWGTGTCLYGRPLLAPKYLGALSPLWSSLWVLSSVQVVLGASEVLALAGDKASPLTCGVVADLPNQCQGVLAVLPWAQEQGHRLHPWCGYCCISPGSSFSTSALWPCSTRVKRTNELLNLKNKQTNMHFGKALLKCHQHFKHWDLIFDSW